MLSKSKDVVSVISGFVVVITKSQFWEVFCVFFGVCVCFVLFCFVFEAKC